MKYLHEDATGVYHLDHRLVPEVSASLAAMSSRMPKGGILARYTQLVETVRRDILSGTHPDTKMTYPRSLAEDRLCVYPLHPRIQEFFNQFVLNYGHSSILELSGQPAIFTEKVSWYTAYLLFDSPLCSGQEFSTRAVRHKDWPMAEECYEIEPVSEGLPTRVPNETLQSLHEGWFEVFEAEVHWWKEEFQSPCPECGGSGELPEFLEESDPTGADRGTYECPDCSGTGKKHPTADKEPFRPALDRARWAIPGTIATGCCHTGHLRERARVLRDGLLLAQRSKAGAATQVWENIREGYTKALPGLSGMGLREAIYSDSSRIPAHLFVGQVLPAEEVRVKLHINPKSLPLGIADRPEGERSYLDPIYNHLARVEITFQPSLAVARDWHRHRTMYPWSLDIVRGFHADIGRSVRAKTGLFFDEGIRIHPAYEPKSDLAKDRLSGLLKASTEAFDDFMEEGNQMQAMLCLPLGTQVQMTGQAGLRDAVYALELRAFTKGANFEYKAQAQEAIRQLVEELGPKLSQTIGLAAPTQEAG